jgi:hypothetical protein
VASSLNGILPRRWLGTLAAHASAKSGKHGDADVIADLGDGLFFFGMILLGLLRCFADFFMIRFSGAFSCCRYDDDGCVTANYVRIDLFFDVN